MQPVQILFDTLWNDYIQRNPSAEAIYDLFVAEGEEVINDHIAYRTFDIDIINIDVLAQWFIKLGYEFKAEYFFEDKHLYAKHFEHKTIENAPRVFISQLITKDFSPFLQNKVNEIVNRIPEQFLQSKRLLTAGNLWDDIPSYEIYNTLRAESEYAAWLYLFGFTVNHFTVSATHLIKLDSLQKINAFLKDYGFALNDSGGEIKGSPEELLEQSSTKANLKKMKFEEGEFEVPVTYYEFAKRYPDSNGNLYSGFIAKSADKIFESTDYYKKS